MDVIVKLPPEGGYWMFRARSYLGMYQDWSLYIVDTLTDTAALPGIPESRAKLNCFHGEWRRPHSNAL